MTTKEAVALLERYSNYDGMGIPNLAGCKEAMRVAVDALKEACPELAESEDEKIRKEIINYILYKADGVSEEQEHSWIAYLEKQKDLDKMIVVSPEVWDNAIADAYENGKKNGEKQKEQKTAEWSEKHIADIFEKVGLAKIAREQGNDELTNALQDAMLELSKVENTEWSEENEQELDCIINILDRLGFEEFCKSSRDQDIEEERFYYKEIQFLKRLKSLRPHWRPSAQELGALKTAVSVLTEERAFPKAAEQIQKIIDVFDGKELRKDWKPSGEQMEVLFWCKPLFCDPTSKKILESLINDLNKLM